MRALDKGRCSAVAIDLIARRRRLNAWSRMQRLDTALYWIAGLLATAWVFAVIGMPIAACSTVISIPVLLPAASCLLYHKAQVAWNRSVPGRSFPLSGFVTVMAVVAMTLVFSFGHADVANAQFMQGAEDFLTEAFGGNVDGEVITLVFNVLRGLFLIYMGIAIVRVLQAARNDQDWQDLARTPLIIVIAVVLGDLLTGVIIGAGGG